MFIIEVTQKVAWSKAGQQRKLLSSLLIIWISKQLVSLFHSLKDACLGKGHEVTLLSMSIMSHTPKHNSQFYNNPFQSLPMLACMLKYYNPVIRRSSKTGLQGNTQTISVVGTVVDDVWSRDVEEGGADRGAEVCVLDPTKVLVLDEDRRPCTSRSALQAYSNKVVRSV
jgi:hypothetical protein